MNETPYESSYEVTVTMDFNKFMAEYMKDHPGIHPNDFVTLENMVKNRCESLEHFGLTVTKVVAK